MRRALWSPGEEIWEGFSEEVTFELGFKSEQSLHEGVTGCEEGSPGRGISMSKGQEEKSQRDAWMASGSSVVGVWRPGQGAWASRGCGCHLTQRFQLGVGQADHLGAGLEGETGGGVWSRRLGIRPEPRHSLFPEAGKEGTGPRN